MAFSLDMIYKDYIATKRCYDFDRNIIEYPRIPIYCTKCNGYVYRKIYKTLSDYKIPKIEYKCEKCNEIWNSIECFEVGDRSIAKLIK